MCMEEITDNSHVNHPEIWFGIWSFKVPPKVKKLILNVPGVLIDASKIAR